MSTHNLGEAERVADRVAVLQERLLALDAPAALRARREDRRVEITGRGPLIGIWTRRQHRVERATAEGPLLHVVLARPRRENAALVEALVRAGAESSRSAGCARAGGRLPVDWWRTAIGDRHDEPPRGRRLLRKELLDVLAQPRRAAARRPGDRARVIVPFIVTIVIPAVIGERLSDDSDLVRLSLIVDPGHMLSPDGRVPALLLPAVPAVVSADADTERWQWRRIRSSAKKLARTLEPCSRRGRDFRAAAGQGIWRAHADALIAMAGLSLYLAGIAIWAMPGVLGGWPTCVRPSWWCWSARRRRSSRCRRRFLISSRVNDARTAQQFGVFVESRSARCSSPSSPGRFGCPPRAWPSSRGLLLIWATSAGVSVRVFDRETILTRWK
jgi:hypothetical protein